MVAALALPLLGAAGRMVASRAIGGAVARAGGSALTRAGATQAGGMMSSRAGQFGMSAITHSAMSPSGGGGGEQQAPQAQQPMADSAGALSSVMQPYQFSQ